MNDQREMERMRQGDIAGKESVARSPTVNITSRHTMSLDTTSTPSLLEQAPCLLQYADVR